MSENNIFLQIQTTFFSKTIAPIVVKFHMKHDQTLGSQKYKIWSGRISKMAAVTKNSKNNNINFCSRTTGYFWLNFGVEYQWNIGIQTCKYEKKSEAFFYSDLLSVY